MAFSTQKPEFKPRTSRENTNSRRFLSSNIKSTRENSMSFRATKTASYPFEEMIDPTTYSFTTALRALQAKALYKEPKCLSPDGFALNSKWNEAEKYICNPLSGEFPKECLSAKTLSGRSSLTISAPLVVSISQTKPTRPSLGDKPRMQILVSEDKIERVTKDSGIQSTESEASCGSPSSISTPPINERLLKESETESSDSSYSSINPKLVQEEEVKEKEEQEKEGRKIKDRDDLECKQSGCLSWIRKTTKQKERHKPTFNTNFANFLYVYYLCL